MYITLNTYQPNKSSPLQVTPTEIKVWVLISFLQLTTIFFLDNTSINSKICLPIQVQPEKADISHSPSYFLMESTWIHSIELHSEKQLVWRLQSCTQRKKSIIVTCQ